MYFSVRYGIFILLLAYTQAALATQWSTANVQLLHGNQYELGDRERLIISLEYAAGWSYGDIFYFADVTQPISAGTAVYTEFSPRLSLNKLIGQPAGRGWLKESFIASTLEAGNGVNAQLLGVGAALSIPGFRFFNINAYLRKSQRDWTSVNSQLGYQLTISWQLPFKIKRFAGVLEGFADYAAGENGGSQPKASNLMSAPRLLLDAGALWHKPDSLLVGIEYQLWRNKFGVSGVDEDVPQVMAKWIF